MRFCHNRDCTSSPFPLCEVMAEVEDEEEDEDDDDKESSDDDQSSSSTSDLWQNHLI